MAKPILVVRCFDFGEERNNEITNYFRRTAPDWNVIVVTDPNNTKVTFEVHSEFNPFIKNELEQLNS